ncbi:DASS family sodium-coupled anion symporter [bacterium]|nr:DASS family sodium-coupled anion symporter [bacterium]
MIDKADVPTGTPSTFRPVFIVLGLVLAVAVQLAPRPDGLSQEAWWVVSLSVLMVVWWITEAIPIPATSLLPMIVLPMTGVASIRDAAAPYADQTIMLLLGGFILAKSVERWNLHSRVALTIVSWAGSRPSALVGGFMAAAALISMWISNTATTLMLTPIAISVAVAMTGSNIARSTLPVALLLGVAWASSIGGLGTPVGSPTNLIVIGYLERELDIAISFQQWMGLGVPVVLLMVPAAWLVVTRGSQRIDPALITSGGKQIVRKAIADLGPITAPEARVAILFAFIASLWVLREPLTGVEVLGVKPLGGLTDHVIAILGAVLCFMIPSGSRTERGTALLQWEVAESIPWGALILFGGGLSLAAAISSTGLADWLGASFSWVTTLSAFLIVLVMVGFVIFATEMTSNVATATTVMPIVGALAAAGGVDPILLAAPVAMAASCAFMLPLATAPNAIVYATGRVAFTRMATLGLKLNIAGTIILATVCYFLTPILFG